MRVESNNPTPVHGVSTLTPRNRTRGHAGLQVNMRSDPLQKLTRRPSMNYLAELGTFANNLVIHEYERRGVNFKLLIDTATGTVRGFVDNVEKVVNTPASSYLQSPNIVCNTINDTTFTLNPDETVRVDYQFSDVPQKASHINVVSALDYGETLEIIVTKAGQVVVSPTVSVVIGAAEDAVTVDPTRRTNAVSIEIASQINAALNVNDIYAEAKGSSVSIWSTEITDTLVVESSSSNATVYNIVTEDIEGLPLYARVGTRITVKPDPTSVAGTYYLDAVALDGTTNIRMGDTGDPTALPSTMEEVVWTESRVANQDHKIDDSTMPHTIVYDDSADEFTQGVPDVGTITSPSIGWDERTKGDDDSCPPPEFLNKKIQALGQFQNRLVLVSDNTVSMTVTDQPYNFWKQSAVDLLVTDPISITSNTPQVDVLEHILEHNRDLLFVATNAQFKLEGTVAVTPESAALPLTTTQEVQTTVKPISMGSVVYMPISYGDSTGIIEYRGKRGDLDIATPLTDHVIGYLAGDARLLVGSPSLNMLAVVTTDADNVIRIFEQHDTNGEIDQQSWSTWELPTDNEILHMEFLRDSLELIVRVGTQVVVKTINMYAKVGVNTEEVFLDDLLVLSSNGVTATVPTNYVVSVDTIVVGGENTNYPLFSEGYSVTGNVITFNNPVSTGTCKVYVGRPYYSGYKPTRPFRYDQEGIAITTDRIRVNRYLLDVVATDKVTMTVDSQYTNPTDQTKSSRSINSPSNTVGQVNLYTGIMQFSYGQNADYAEATFWTNSWLGMTIAGISWKGQYHKSSGRM